MAKWPTSTRNTTFNYYVEGNTLMSIASVSATSKYKNITLLEYDDPIEVTGKQINTDAAKNTTYTQLSGAGATPIDTGIPTEDESKVYKVYGAPHKLVFDNRQQYNNCGMECCLNILVMAGKKTIANQNTTETAFTEWGIDHDFCEDENGDGILDKNDGATSLTSLKRILNYYDMDAKIWSSDPEEDNDYFEDEEKTKPLPLSVDGLATLIKNGGAAIIAVDSQVLSYGDTDDPSFNHAILVSGVVYDDADNLVGFYIQDSGVWMTRFISVDELKRVSYYNVNNGDKKLGFFCTVVEDAQKSYHNNTTATGSNAANIIQGNTGNNMIYGKGGNDILYGNDGNDGLYGGKGNDTIYGGNGEDYILGGAGNDTIEGNDDDDEISGGSGNDKIYGGAGNDLIYGDSGKDTIYGDAGIDKIHGGAGNDLIYGGAGNDLIYGDSGKDTIYGDDGIDEIHGGSGNDKIYGGADNDVINGDSGNDTLYGEDGADEIYGGAGNDYIYGGAGNDTIDCGAGKDHVYFDGASGKDTVASVSGSVTFHFDDIVATDLNYEIENSSLLLGYDDLNYIDYSDFYNSEKNKCQTAYIVDENEAGVITKYRFLATGAEGKIKVATSKGNNILYSMGDNDNIITTSKYADIVFMYGGNDSITFTGGKDYYFSTEGSDTYTVSTFGKKTHLTISDTSTQADNDSLYINSTKNAVSLFFDVTPDGNISQNNDLILFNNSYIKTLTGFQNMISGSTNGVVILADYFGVDSALGQGYGYIDSIYAKNGKVYSQLDINSTLEAIASEVVTWLAGKGYAGAFDAIQQNVEGVEELIAIYQNAGIDIVQNA
ncbi:MAG: hypothetical protein K6E29_00095 [Cyanobacteria bacterium RUI128]|nr:hypothetical protein [Cyanobacteria bacterium RUI128]